MAPTLLPNELLRAIPGRGRGSPWQDGNTDTEPIVFHIHIMDGDGLGVIVLLGVGELPIYMLCSV
jgi:hypothetical protein